MQTDVSNGRWKVAHVLVWLLIMPLARFAGVPTTEPAGSGFCLGTDGPVNVIVLQRDDKILVGGTFTNLGGQPHNNIARLNADGSLDATFNSSANDVVAAIAVQPDGKIVVGGGFDQLLGQPRSHLGRLNADGSLDTSFNSGDSGPNDAQPPVVSIALQADGKILVGGSFRTLGGQPRGHLARLNADGSLDTSFNSGADSLGATVSAIAVQSDARILVGGSFITLGGSSRTNIGRLNADGSVDSAFSPGFTDGEVSSLAVQPNGTIVVGGSFTMLGGQRRDNLGRLSANGSLDTAFNPGPNGSIASVLAIEVQTDDKILIGGRFTALGGQPRTNMSRLNADGSVDSVFNPGLSSDGQVSALAVRDNGEILSGGNFNVLGGESRNSIGRLLADGRINPDDCPENRLNPTPSRFVTALAVQSDAKTLVGSNFSTLGGQPGRLNADGSLDATFNPRANNIVRAIAVQADGKILLGGEFTELAGQPRTLVGRLNIDGSLDSSFNADADFIIPDNFIAEIRPTRDLLVLIWAIAVQADGRILIGGSFELRGVQPLRNFARLNSDGSLDTSFNADADALVRSIAVQADGKILVGGSFNQLGGQPRAGLGRFNPDGSLDATFDPRVTGRGPNVSAIALQADGKILVGGLFTGLGGQPRAGIGRLNADGSLDASFNPGIDGRGAQVHALASQTDGKILVGGIFTKLGGQPRASLGRLNADGSLDSFNISANIDVAGFDSSVDAIALLADGKILVGGLFTTLGSEPRRNLGRLLNSTPAVQSLGVKRSGGKTFWSRSGASPEVVRVTFEFSTDGINYKLLGAGKRTETGWKRGGLNAPRDRNFFIRARGYYAGSVVELVANLSP